MVKGYTVTVKFEGSFLEKWMNVDETPEEYVKRVLGEHFTTNGVRTTVLYVED